MYKSKQPYIAKEAYASLGNGTYERSLRKVVCKAGRRSKPSRAKDGLWKALDFS